MDSSARIQKRLLGTNSIEAQFHNMYWSVQYPFIV